MRKKITYTILMLSLLWLSTFTGCSIRKLALTKVSDALAGDGGTVFSGDNDPELVKDALPFALKMYESLLQQLPQDDNLLIATGKAFCMYSYAFIQSSADTMSDINIELKIQTLDRAKKMYLRSLSYLLRAFEVRHPGFRAQLDSNNIEAAIAMTTEADTTLLYWSGNAWLAAYSIEPTDSRIGVHISKPVAFMHRVLELNERYGRGSIHDFFISWYGNLPVSMGGDEEKIQKHFTRSLALSGGTRAGTYVSMATATHGGKKDSELFKDLLHKALAIDIDVSVSDRLANILSQRKAQWLLDHIDNYFLLP